MLASTPIRTVRSLPMSVYLLIKTLHILSSTLLFGTGMGIAFFMLRSAFTRDIPQKLYAARNTVLADGFFTLPAVIVQPATGIWLILHAGFNPLDFWLVVTYGLYLLAGACWLPVVWIQLQLKKMLEHAVTTATPLPPRYHQLFKWWFALGWPAFTALVVIFYLMVAKPA